MVRALRIIALLAMLAGIGSARAAAPGGVDWPRYRGPLGDGLSTERGWTTQWPKDGPKVLWTAKIGQGFGSLSIASGKAYVMGHDADHDVLYCFDAVNGQEQWKQRYPQPLTPNMYEGGPNTTPTVDGGKVFTLSKEGDLYCFDAATGAVTWQRNVAREAGAPKPTWGFAGSPLVLGNLIIVNVGASGVAVNRANGQVVWKSSGKAGYASPVPFQVGGMQAVAIFAGEALVAVNAANGAKLWSHPWKTSHDVNAADPIVIGDKIFISSGYGTGCALLQYGVNGVREDWKNKNMKNQMYGSVLVDGHLYGFDGDQQSKPPLVCMELATGAVKWSQPINGPGGLIASDGKLIVLNARGLLSIVAANPAGYQEMARAQILGGRCWTVPALAHGRIYARNATGDVVCVDVSGK